MLVIECQQIRTLFRRTSLSPAHLDYSFYVPHFHNGDISIEISDENNEDVHFCVRNSDYLIYYIDSRKSLSQYTIVYNSLYYISKMEKMDGAKYQSKLVSTPCKQFCFCYTLGPNYDQNYIKHNFRQCKFIHVSRILAHRRFIQVCTQHF